MAANVSAVLMFIGAFFMLVAALGVVRFPDLFMRLHSSTKSATLGAGCLMLGAALHFNQMGLSARALAVIVFLVATAPVAAHLLGRAAYLSGVPLWEGTLSDELHGRYSNASHDLASPPNPSPAETPSP